MVRIKQVRYMRLKSFQDRYENVGAELMAEVPDPDAWAKAPTWEQVYADLQGKVNAKLDEEISKPLEFQKSEELKRIDEALEGRKRELKFMSGMQTGMLEALKELEAEIKHKRNELDRCIEVGMRWVFQETVSMKCSKCGNVLEWVPFPVLEDYSRACPKCGTTTTCPGCGKSIYLIEAVGEGWSRICPFCSYRFPPPPQGAGEIKSEGGGE